MTSDGLVLSTSDPGLTNLTLVCRTTTIRPSMCKGRNIDATHEGECKGGRGESGDDNFYGIHLYLLTFLFW